MKLSPDYCAPGIESQSVDVHGWQLTQAIQNILPLQMLHPLSFFRFNSMCMHKIKKLQEMNPEFIRRS